MTRNLITKESFYCLCTRLSFHKVLSKQVYPRFPSHCITRCERALKMRSRSKLSITFAISTGTVTQLERNFANSERRSKGNVNFGYHRDGTWASELFQRVNGDCFIGILFSSRSSNSRGTISPDISKFPLSDTSLELDKKTYCKSSRRESGRRGETRSKLPESRSTSTRPRFPNGVRMYIRTSVTPREYFSLSSTRLLLPPGEIIAIVNYRWRTIIRDFGETARHHNPFKFFHPSRYTVTAPPLPFRNI